ncbi:MAG: sugar ABC transporter ATP-binding protein [Galactobacter sp.]|uniref:sugar ABC transporter ATP-binding protein n=1 Tax=Galactobacter sp. TaxID=2676125 RepID=UPI0025C3240D|nr:sugar ABC transporter ATP-binding protein [Galactobacter sp.]
MPTSQPVVRMTGITVEFPGVKALDNVGLTLWPGEVHTIMGENGAGKSTLIKALTGVYGIDAGVIEVDGQQVSFTGPGDAQSSGVATVYQEVNLCDNLTIGENVMLGNEIRGGFGINWRKTHERARLILGEMGLSHLDTHAPLSSLALAVQQLVAIARSLVTDTKVLILDEPTSSLDANEVEVLFNVIRDLRDRGVAILFVSHFLDQVYEISDRLTVLRNGKYIAEHLTAEIPRQALIAEMIGKDLTEQDDAPTAERVAGEHEDFMVLTGSGAKGIINPTDLTLKKGEVMGFAGLLGSGRTELARIITGADSADTGTITVNGESVKLRSPRTAIANRIALTSENRRDEGIIGDLTVRENLVLAVQAKRGWFRRVPKREADEIVDKYMARLNVRPADPDRPIKNLSGGNQQKVVLGRWLATAPELLVLDEPTRGIDIGAKTEISNLILELAEGGMSVVFISSELAEVARLSHRITVLRDHQVIAELENGPDVTPASIVAVIAEEAEPVADLDAAVDAVDEKPDTENQATDNAEKEA